ncbi:MAG: hypothetical protein QOC87_1789 [Actinomycetota bacterium]|nr:hypothetical protein [Actinomycetota bacterium]
MTRPSLVCSLFAMRGRSKVATAITAALACALASVAAPGGAKGYRSTTRSLGYGVTYTNIYDPRGPWHIRYLSVDLAAESTLDVALANNEIPGFETTSSMARSHGALAAINGDYGRSTGRPIDVFADDGRLITTSLIYGRNFEWNQQETSTFIGHPHITTTLRPSTAGPISIDAVNDTETSPAGDVREFTPKGGSVETPPQNQCQVRVEPTGSPQFNSGAGTQTPMVVDKTRCGRALKRLNGDVVSATRSSAAAGAISSLVPGESASLRWSGDVSNLMDTVGGNPTLIDGGQVQRQSVDGTAPFLLRHPRTGIGTTGDGHVLLVTVDGREPGYSVGMSLREFSSLFASLGATYALNIDGGGSTTFYVKGKGVLNRPSDGNERAVSSSLLVLPGPGSKPSPSPSILPSLSPSLSPSPGTSPAVAAIRDASVPAPLSRAATWRAIVTDPASTGGMARWLATKHAHVPRYLRRAARRFRRSRR